MSEKKTEVKQETVVETPFYKKVPFWLIVVAIILIIIVGIIVYTQIGSTTLTTTTLVLYGLALLFLIIGVLWAAWS